MANRVLTIVAKVKDAASAGLDRIQDRLKKTGGAAKQTAVDFTQFNKVMFSTTAYIGFFEKAFRGFGDTLLKGAEFSRVVNQFERVMGPKGDLFAAISGFTDNSIDKVEALRSAIQLKTLGIANSTSQVAELIARAGTASKMAGMDSGEGIKKFTQFLKDGSIANLEFLNLIKSSDPALKLQMSMIGKIGGVLGGAMTSQMKYNMGLRLLRTATEGSLKGQRDLYDVVFDLRQSFTLLKNEMGIFLGTALASVLDKVTKVADKFSTMLEYIRETKKEVLFLAKSLIVVGSAFSALMASAGTIRLLSLGLKALGISTTPIIFGVTTLIGLFSALTFNVKEGLTPVERFVEKLRVFGAVMKGIHQLVSSFLGDQKNMSKGIGQIDRDLFELLNKNGLFVFVHKVSQAIAVVGKFGIEVFKELRSWAMKLDEIFGGISNKMFEIFGVNKKINVDLDATGNVIDEPAVKRLSAMWLSANTKSYGLLKKGAAAILVAFAAYKVFGIGKGFLSKIPLLGRLFGGPKGGKPDGTKSNPMHVVVDGGGFGSILKEGLLSSILGKRVLGPVMKGAPALGRVGGIMATPIVRVFTKPIMKVAAPIIRMVAKPAAAARSTFAGLWMTLAPLISSSTMLGKIFSGIANVGTKITGLFTSIGNISLGAMFRGLFAKAWIGIASRLVGLKDVIGVVMAGFQGLSKVAVAARAFAIVHLVIAAAGLLVGVIKGMVDNFSSFTGLFGAAYDYLRSVDYAKMFSDLYDSISSTFASVATFIGDTFSTVYDTVSAAISEALAPIREFGAYLFAKLQEGFGIIAPYIQMVLTPIGEMFKVFGGWLTVAGQALKGFYDWISNLPVVGDLIKATVQSMADPFGTFKGLGEMAVGIPAIGADMLSNSLKDATAKNLLDSAQGGQGKLMFTPGTSEERSDYAMRAIQQASGADQDRMARAYREAMLGTSAGGKEITPEEFAKIFGFALDNSKIAKHTKDTAVEVKDGKKTALTSRRGGC